MKCRRYREAVVAHARSMGEPREFDRARAHVESCAACRQALAEQQELTAGLRALSEIDRAELPSDGLEAKLLAAFEAQRTTAAVPATQWLGAAAWLRWGRLWPVAAGLAAAGAVVWVALSGPATEPQARSDSAPAGIVELEGFQAIPLAVALPDFDSGAIVRTEIAVNALPVYGVRIPQDAASEAVRVDLLVGQDGHPRAIRLVTEEFQGTRSRR